MGRQAFLGRLENLCCRAPMQDTPESSRQRIIQRGHDLKMLGPEAESVARGGQEYPVLFTPTTPLELNCRTPKFT